MNYEGLIVWFFLLLFILFFYICVYLVMVFMVYGLVRMGNVKFVFYKEGEKVYMECFLRVGYDQGVIILMYYMQK